MSRYTYDKMTCASISYELIILNPMKGYTDIKINLCQYML